MSTTVSMPQLGETVTEGTILRWAKQVGEVVAVDEVLVEISTDKVDTEVPSPAGGTILEILVPEGETVEVGTAMCVIGDVGESPGESEGATGGPAPAPVSVPEPEPAPEPVPAEPVPAEPVSAGDSVAPVAESAAASIEERRPGGRVLSPVVRRLVREHGVDVTLIPGTGEGGRVTRRDVEAYIAAAPSELTATPTAPEPPSAPVPPPVEAPPVVAAPATEPVTAPPSPASAPAGDADEVVPISRLRTRIAENMVRSKQTAAHVWTSVEVDYERVERVRQAHRAAFKEAEGFSLTYLPFIARATVDALAAYPVVNSSFDLENLQATFHRSVQLGIAIDLDGEGLVVARIRDADGLRLVGLARQVRSLAEGARSASLELDDLTGSTFTITNPGPFGSFMSAPVINLPNVAILSTDTVVKRPAVVTGADGEDVIAIRHIGYLGLTWDHRSFDGSTAVKFLRRIKHNLESWDWEQELT